MGLGAVSRKTLAPLVVAGQPIEEGEVAVFDANGQIKRSRQSDNGALLNPIEGNITIDAVNAGIDATADAGISLIAAGTFQARSTANSSILGDGNGNRFEVTQADVIIGTDANDEAAILRGNTPFELGLFGAEPVVQGNPTTSAEWTAYLKAVGLIGDTGNFPAGGGGAEGISNPSGTQIQIGDATFTDTTIGPLADNSVFIGNDIGEVARIDVLPTPGTITINSSNGTTFIGGIGFFGAGTVPQQTITAADAAAIDLTLSKPLKDALIAYGLLAVV